jgi:hypothetical protein
VENTLSEAEKGRLPDADEHEFVEQLYRGTFSVFLGQPKAIPMLLVDLEWANGTYAAAAQPDVPRNLLVALADSENACTGTCTILGVDSDGNVITEVLQPDGEGGGKELLGTKIFARIDSIVISNAAGGDETTLLAAAGGDIIGFPCDILARAAVRHIYFNQTYVHPDDAVIAVGVSTSGVDVHNIEAYDGVKTLLVFLQPTRRA